MTPRHTEAARRILDHVAAVYSSPHDYAVVDARDFRHLDLGFYNRTQRLLEDAGFRHLADLEDRTLNHAPHNLMHRVLMRTLCSQDGQIAAGLYHPKLRSFTMRLALFFLGRRLGRIVDFETEFSDGSFLCTSNARTASAITLPPIIQAEYWPVNTPVPKLLARHRERVATALETHQRLAVRPVRALADVQAAQHRLDAIKAAYRGEIGGVTLEELQALSLGADAQLAADVQAEIEAELLRR